MGSKVIAGKSFELRPLWFVFGLLLEFSFIPSEIHGTSSALHHGDLFTSGDFYYAVISPAVIWWFLYRLAPSKEDQLGQSGVRLLNFIFGLYVSSVVRSAFAAFCAIHLGVWTITHK
jgi:hypothetical protein